MKEYRLEIDPRILELLGPSLYTNIYYVLAELIANAYDADAENVYIIANKDEIRVEDDGHGMSYEKGDVARYLNVASASRLCEEDSLTRSGKRRKMGRKGVGKLAALSVSADVDILTICNRELSGFVLSRHPEDGSRLRPIPEEEIAFDKIGDHGCAVVMRYPQYRLHKTIDAVKRNLLKMFPLVNQDFRIHIIRDHQEVIIDEFDKNVMSELCALITLGTRFSSLCDLLPNYYPSKWTQLVESRKEFIRPFVMKDTNGDEHEYNLEIHGWLGAYKTTKGRKAELKEFPDNFISLFANQKLGEFNILPVVGHNKLNEVYAVGQLHVDLFELTELPDMALSNRQGYKSDDPRYTIVLDYVRDNLLLDILKKRDKFADFGKAKKKQMNIDAQKEKEEELRQAVKQFRTKVSRDASEQISGLGKGTSSKDIEKAISHSIDANSFNFGLKHEVDSLKKRILISQTSGDKSLSDTIYAMLRHNNVPEERILYTNCDDEVCRIPEGMHIYDYLRDFFVDSYSTEKIYVLFVTSENTKSAWGAITEVGAAWITQIDHKIFNIPPFRPEHPLDDTSQWHNTNRDNLGSREIWLTNLSADIFCQKIETVCNRLDYPTKSRGENRQYLSTLIQIRDI